DEERVDPVEVRGLGERLDGGEVLPGADGHHVDGQPPRDDLPAVRHRAAPRSSSARGCQISPYSWRYSALSRRLITSRGRGSLTSYTSLRRPGRRVMTTMRSARVMASERSWVTNTTVWCLASQSESSSACRPSFV